MSIPTAKCIKYSARVVSKIFSLARCLSSSEKGLSSPRSQAGVVTLEPNGCPHPGQCWYCWPSSEVPIDGACILFPLGSCRLFLRSRTRRWCPWSSGRSLSSSRSPCSTLRSIASMLVPWSYTSLRIPYDTWRRPVGRRWEFRLDEGVVELSRLQVLKWWTVDFLKVVFVV